MRCSVNAVEVQTVGGMAAFGRTDRPCDDVGDPEKWLRRREGVIDTDCVTNRVLGTERSHRTDVPGVRRIAP